MDDNNHISTFVDQLSQLPEILGNCIFSQVGSEICIHALNSQTTDKLYKQKRRLRQVAASVGFTRIVFGDTEENWNIAVRRMDTMTTEASTIVTQKPVTQGSYPTFSESELYGFLLNGLTENPDGNTKSVAILKHLSNEGIFANKQIFKSSLSSQLEWPKLNHAACWVANGLPKDNLVKYQREALDSPDGKLTGYKYNACLFDKNGDPGVIAEMRCNIQLGWYEGQLIRVVENIGCHPLL